MLINELQKNKIDSLFIDISERLESIGKILKSTKASGETEKKVKKFFEQKIEPMLSDLGIITEFTVDLFAEEDFNLDEILDRYTPEE